VDTSYFTSRDASSAIALSDRRGVALFDVHDDRRDTLDPDMAC
jgi:hypothetical protein